ncbi:MAG: RNase adapter RapZ [Clostridia bacterium]|nr:RNase adapter RapZ [Clostridia bacterium]
MRMVLVTGLSGAGKTQIIRVLEDIGFYCVDNLPPVMIPQFIKTCENSGEINETAVVVDTRGSIFLDGINEALDAVESAGVQTEILFLEATDSVIINRYKETRRTHPMEEKQMSLEECIAYERNVLQPIRDRASLIIDTSNMQTKELWRTVLSIYRPDESASAPTLSIMSFGFKKGVPQEADLVFDARFLPNPYYIPELKNQTGLDAAVYSYVMSFPEAEQFLDKLKELLLFVLPFYIREGNKYPCIAIGCTGGQHRSVSIARALGYMLGQSGYMVDVRHRELKR